MHAMDDPISAFADLLGMRVTAAGSGHAELSLAADSRLTNMSGLIHGGVLVGLMDTACGVAATSLEGGMREGRVVTLSFSTQFLRPAKTGTLRAVAEKTGGGQQTLMLDARVLDEKDHVLATGHGTFRRIRWPR